MQDDINATVAQNPEADPKDGAGSDTESRLPNLPELTFDTLPELLRRACERAGWSDLMPVQRKAMPFVLKGKDVMVQARTGSGKTGAFVLPLIDKLDPESPHCQALVLVPTRELALQVSREAKMLAGDESIRVVAVYGGVGYKEQLDAFREGAHLVVGTPGRVLDHLMRRSLSLDKLKVLIFDEADRMLSVGFYPDMKEIGRYLPKRLWGAFMFSATFPPTVLRLADEFLNQPGLLSLSGDHVHVADSEHIFCEVPRMGRERVLVRMVEIENPTSAIIFCNTINDVEFVAAVLQRFGYDAEPLSSKLSQSKRESVLGRIREGRLRFLVATDVAARGIDIPELSHVFLYEPPEDQESYIHRAGRTGRAGASGTVISLVDLMQRRDLMKIAKTYKIDLLERPLPEEKDVVEVVEERLVALLEKKRRAMGQISRERVERFTGMAGKLAQDEESRVLLAMLLDELYQESLHAPPPKPDGPKRVEFDSPEKRRPKRRRKPRGKGGGQGGGY